MKVVTICGSVRPNNYTSKALNLVLDEFSRLQDKGQKKIEVVPVWLEKIEFSPPGTANEGPTIRQLRESVEEATGLVIATPEYHGSFSSVLKLMIENLGFPSPIAGKPIALLGVASGQIGAIKSMEHLRSVCSHVGAIVLPNFVSVPLVNKVFDEKGLCLDEKWEKLIRGVATSLLHYIEGAICPKMVLEAMVRSQENSLTSADRN